jgi:proline iminopeptidase
MASHRHRHLSRFFRQGLFLSIAICLGIILISGHFLFINHSRLLAQTELREEVSGYVDSHQAKIFYRIYGEGKPLLLINGGPGFPSNHFVPLAQELAKNKRQVIIFDQRGTGRSQLPKLDKTTVNMQLMIDDMEALRNHLQLPSWSLMGHSFGGVLAMSYAAKYPDYVDGMILSASGGIDLDFSQYITANIAVRLSPTQRNLLDYWSKQIRDNKDVDRAIEKRLEVNLAGYVFYPENRETIIKALTETSQLVPIVNDLVWKDLSEQKYDLTDKLKNFQKPVLVIQGRQDFIGESTAIKINQTIPNSKLVFINECGHSIWLDQGEKYFSAIAEFLKKA